MYPDPNFGTLKIDHRSSRAFRYHSRPISRKNRKQVSFSNHRDISATFRDCRGPSVPIETCLELSGPSQHTSGPLSYIRSLSKTIWTNRHIFGAVCLLSLTIRTHQLHSGTVRDNLYRSAHVWRYLVQFSILQDPSTTFRVCRRPSGPIETSLELSVCIRQPSGHISYTQGRTVRVLSSEVQCISSRVFW